MQDVSLDSFLFGDILGVTMTDIYRTGMIAIAILAVVWISIDHYLIGEFFTSQHLIEFGYIIKLTDAIVAEGRSTK